MFALTEYEIRALKGLNAVTCFETEGLVLLKESLSLIVTLGGIPDENEDRAEWIG